MDWGSLANAIAGSAAPWVNGLFEIVSTNKTNKSNERSVNNTNATSTQIAQENNAMQERLNAENNQFSHDEAELAYQRELEKMQLEQNYNSPIEQLKRFREAGVNPSVAFAGNMTQAVGGSSSASAPQATPHGSGVTPSMPNLIAPHAEKPKLAVGLMDGLVKSAQIAKEFAEAVKTKKEAAFVDQFYQSTIQKINSEVEGQNLANLIQSTYGASKAGAEIALMAQQAQTSALQGETEKARALCYQAEEYLNRQLGDLRGSERRHQELVNSTFMTQFKAMIDNIQAQSAASRATAANQSAQAQTEDELRQWRADLLKADKEVRDKQVDQLKGLITAIDQENLRTYLTPWEIKHLREMSIQDIEEQLKSDHWQNTLIGRFARFFGGASTMGAAAIGGASNVRSAAIRAGSIP